MNQHNDRKNPAGASGAGKKTRIGPSDLGKSVLDNYSAAEISVQAERVKRPKSHRSKKFDLDLREYYPARIFACMLTAGCGVTIDETSLDKMELRLRTCFGWKL